MNATITNPPTTCHFDTAEEARDHLTILGFRHLPVRGAIRRYAADQVADDGTPIITFASSTFRTLEDGDVHVHFVEIIKGKKS